MDYEPERAGAVPPPIPPLPPRAAGFHEHPHKRKRFSGFLLFCMSVLPGIGYMYLGLIKRGLFFLSVFFGGIYAAGQFGMDFLVPCLAIMYFAVLFDSFKKRAKLENGEFVPDNIDEIKEFFYRHKTIIICASVVVLAMWFINNIGWFLFRFEGMNWFNKIVAVLLVAFGAIVLFSRKK
ncbi:MAG: hypothetical protein LBM16_05790 [Clostridiales bacterium]|jgi:TM2 domain-containing membrane protein YozV|nr:hypothetical protein [Clostridiales bacterium]